MSTDLNRTLSEMYKSRRHNQQPKQQQQQHQPSNGKKPRVEEVASIKTAQHPKITFQDLFGCDEDREQLIRIVECFNRGCEDKAKKLEWPILITGSNGLGKTSLVEASANYAKLPLIALSMKKQSIKSRNELHTHLESFIDQCLACQPAVVLLDDINRLNGKEEKIELLTDTLDRLLSEDLNLLVFCTASSVLDEHFNHIQFSLSIQLKRPNVKARLQILNFLIDKYPFYNELKSLESNIETLALDTPSFTASDIRRMLEIASIESKGLEVSLKNCQKAINVIKQSFKQGTLLIGERPSTTWDDIGGMSEVRSEFWNILNEAKSGDVDCQFAGIALYGPPGCGKTMVARAMANETGFNFISINPTELMNKFFGETERNIRRVFREAREYEPCIIYFDEFDGLCGTRGSKDNMTNAIQTLLSEMDGFASRGKSIILVSTNRLEDIDPAMKRPGRLSRHIYVGLPNEEDRKHILEKLIAKYKIEPGVDVDLSHWASMTRNFSGADLAFLIHEAKPRGTTGLNKLSNTSLEASFNKLNKISSTVKKSM